MGGFSGKAVASHTPIVTLGSVNFAVSPAQMRIVRRCLELRAAGKFAGVYVKGRELVSAQRLVSIKIGTLDDDGPDPVNGSNADGERWTFTLAEGVSCRST